MKIKKLLSVILTAIIVLSALPLTVSAYNMFGGIIIEGGKSGADYKFENNVITIISSTPVRISNREPDKETSERIVVAKDVSANITLAGVNIRTTSPFFIEDGSKGNVRITLEKDTTNTLTATLISCAGIEKNSDPDDGTLTIDGEGTLIATGSSGGSGIGNGTGMPSNNIIIESGNIFAYGGSNYGIGIGGNITVNGGNITAKGSARYSFGAAAIGGGKYSTSQSVTINGGVIRTIHNQCSDIISEHVFINGGTVTAEEIGSDNIVISPMASVKATTSTVPVNVNGTAVVPHTVENPDKSPVAIDGVTLPVTCHEDENRLYLYLCSDNTDITVNGKTENIVEYLTGRSGISVSGEYYKDYKISENTVTILSDAPMTFSNKDPERETDTSIFIPEGQNANIILDGVNINSGNPIMIADESTGNVNITLADGSVNKLTNSDGVCIIKNSDRYATLDELDKTGTLTINGNTGVLDLHSGFWDAAIGGGNKCSSANIVINGGVINMHGGSGIGTGTYGTVSNIVINGGDITAVCETGTGIGCQSFGHTYGITINGGSIRATGDDGAGIGGGFLSNVSGVRINGGNIYSESARGVGIGAYKGNSFDAVITGGVITSEGIFGRTGATDDAITLHSGVSLKTESISGTPKDENGVSVYCIEIENPDEKEIYLDGEKCAYGNHPGTQITYIYTNGTDHTVRVGDAASSVIFDAAQQCFPRIHYSTHTENKKDAGCTQDGLTGDTVCDICGRTLEYGEVIPAHGHKYAMHTFSSGKYEYKCEYCGDTYDITGTKIGNYVISGEFGLDDIIINDDVVNIRTSMPLVIQNANRSEVSKQPIHIESDCDSYILLSNVNIDGSYEYGNAPAISIGQGSGHVTIEVNSGSMNTLTGGLDCPAIEFFKNTDAKDETEKASLVICGSGTLTAQAGGFGAAAIGSPQGKDTENITVDGPKVFAAGRNNAAAIGSGVGGNADNIVIKSGIIEAKPSLGEGYEGSGSPVVIYPEALVFTQKVSPAPIDANGNAVYPLTVENPYNENVVIGEKEYKFADHGKDILCVYLPENDYTYSIGKVSGTAVFDKTENAFTTVHVRKNELVGAVEETCMRDGYTGDSVCAYCGEVFEKGTVIPAHGHTYSETDERVRVREVTCTKPGYTGDIICTTCGSIAVAGEIVPYTGHKTDSEMPRVGIKAATCTEDGYTGDILCIVCNEAVQKGEIVPRRGHTPDKTEELSDGVYEHHCAVCDSVYETTDEAFGPFIVGGITEYGGVSYSEDKKALIISSGDCFSVRNADISTPCDSHIEITRDTNARITLCGVNISADGSSALIIADNSKGDVTLTLDGGSDNSLVGGSGCAGISKNGAYGTLHINGEGSLFARGKSEAAGIGAVGNNETANIIIEGGVITAKGGADSAPAIGCTSRGKATGIKLLGGVITAQAGTLSDSINSTGSVVVGPRVSLKAEYGKGNLAFPADIRVINESNKSVTLNELVIPEGEKLYINGSEFPYTSHGGENTVYVYLSDNDVYRIGEPLYIELTVDGKQFSAVPHGGNTKEGIIAVAYYDSGVNGKLLEIKLFDLSKSESAEGTFSSGGMCVKAFWWKDLSASMTPVCEPAVYCGD